MIHQFFRMISFALLSVPNSAVFPKYKISQCHPLTWLPGNLSSPPFPFLHSFFSQEVIVPVPAHILYQHRMFPIQLTLPPFSPDNCVVKSMGTPLKCHYTAAVFWDFSRKTISGQTVRELVMNPLRMWSVNSINYCYANRGSPFSDIIVIWN